MVIATVLFTIDLVQLTCRTKFLFSYLRTITRETDHSNNLHLIKSFKLPHIMPMIISLQRKPKPFANGFLNPFSTIINDPKTDSIRIEPTKIFILVATKLNTCLPASLFSTPKQETASYALNASLSARYITLGVQIFNDCLPLQAGLSI